MASQSSNYQGGCSCIKLNETVILQKGNVLKAIKLVPGKIIVFEKLRFKPENAIGLKFGTLFNGKIIPNL